VTALLVAHIAPIFATVPPVGYGGVERVIEELAATQVEVCEGVDVLVLASSDSRPTARSAGRYESIRSRDPALSIDETFEEMRRHYRWAFDEAERLGADLAHLHGPWGLEYFPQQLPMRSVASIYDDTSRPDVHEPLLSPPAGAYLVANSESTREKAAAVPWFATVLEGVLVDRYPAVDDPEPYCCFVGELLPDKGLDIAVSVARAARMPLKIIGRPRMLDVAPELVAEQQDFLDRLVFPYVDGSTVEYLGELGEDRLPVVANASALLAPIRIDEPFGRAMAEAMACGTPVVAFRRGSVPEILEHGVSGFAVSTVSEMVDGLERVRSLDRARCRAHVRERLNMRRVAMSYAAVYGDVAAFS
jgi:glycosyltransferase involved in cell wall biosynthesis